MDGYALPLVKGCAAWMIFKVIPEAHNEKHYDLIFGECVAACSTGALNIGICKPTKSKVWNIVPSVLTVVLIAFGMWAGGKIELPTIDMKWGIENVAEDGTVTQLVDPDALQTMSVEGLRSVKCYGSSMTFKAKLEKVPGVHGVKTYVKRHSADILYDPAKTNPDKIQEAIYVPSKFRVATPDHTAVPELKIVTIRTEGMYDKMDINYLGMQMRQTGKRIYGLETEFACPLIVRVYMDPAEDLDEDWFEEIVEMEMLSMPVHGGGTNDIELNYKFEDYEGETGRISTEQFIRNMFSPFSVQWKSRIEAAEGKQQYVYEIVDKNYEKPIILRNMPFLSNHLSRHEGVIGVYLELNKDLQPAIQIRYAEPMTEEKLWELMTMETWTITYKKDDVREEGAKISFKTPGVSYEYID
jgi:copper chaperone CopZ